MKKIIILFIVVVVVVLGVWYVFTQTVSAPVAPVVTNTSPPSQIDGISQLSTPSLSAVVNYSSNGFEPKAVTIKQGGTVTFTSVDGSPMWVASGLHPTHFQYDGTSRTEHCGSTTSATFDQCRQGSLYTFTFLKAGEWDYHNHIDAGDGGVITVVP